MDLARAPFAALMLAHRARHATAQAAAGRIGIAVATLADYCAGRSLPKPARVKRMAPNLGMTIDDLAEVVRVQREAMRLRGAK